MELSKCLVKASCKFFEIIWILFLFYDLFRLHEYIGRVIYMTREPNPTTTPSLASDTIVTPLTSVHRVGAFPTLNNMCRSSDDLEDAFLERLALDFADEAMDTVLFDQSVDTRSGLMDGASCPSTTYQLKKKTS